jgi:hypothetical protein
MFGRHPYCWTTDRFDCTPHFRPSRPTKSAAIQHDDRFRQSPRSPR